MPRRATTSEAPDDNRVKMENVRVKQEKLRNKGKQRVNALEEGSEEDAEGEPDEDAPGEQEEEELTPRGSKRIRLNGEGDSRPNSNGHGSQQVPKMKTLPRDTDGYV
jgi:structural maintenance of chromosomes protein 5